MTAPTDDRRAVEQHPLELELPPHGTGVRAARRAAAAAARAEAQQAVSAPSGRSPSRRWMAGFVASICVSVVLAGVLAYVGVETLRESSTGRRVASTDPSDPGFEGLLAPTPTLIVVHQTDGVLKSAALLALANGDRGGSVMLLPTSVEVGDGDDAATMAVTYAFGGTPDVMRGAGEAIAGVGVESMVLLDAERWASLVAPVAPLTIDNPNDIEGFDAGPVQLEAADVASWLEATYPGESELGILYRQSLFWESWVAAVARSSDPAAVPGELDSGMGRFVRALAAGPLTVSTIPVSELTDATGNMVFEVDRDALREVITDLVPFPTGTELAPRTRVRLLDGAGRRDHVTSVAPIVVASDSTIVVVGNADAFDYQTTEVRYHQPAQRQSAERLRDALGAGRVVEDVRPIDSFDVTIVLGTDV